MEQKIWVVPFKIKLRDDSPAYFGGPQTCHGESLVPTESKDDAIKQTTTLLESFKVDILSIDECQIYDENLWNDDSEASVNVRETVEMVKFSKNIQFTTYRPIEE